MHALETLTLLERDSSIGSSCEICKIFKNTLFHRPSTAAASGFQSATLLKKRLWQRCLSLNFTNFHKSFLRMTASCVYLWILRSFSEHLFYRASMGRLQEKTSIYSKKLIHRYFPSILSTRKSHSKAFILLKIPENYLRRSSAVMKLRDANLQVYDKKTLSHILFHVVAFIFSEYITITSSEEALTLCEHCNLPVQSRLIWYLTFSWVQFSSCKLDSLFLGI